MLVYSLYSLYLKKKIFFLVNTLSFFISHRLEIAIAAKNNDFIVQIGYGEIGNTKLSILEKKGIELYKLPLERKSFNPFTEIKTLLSIIKVFKKINPDIVHLVTIKAYLYGGIAARLLKVPCVVSAIAGFGILNNDKQIKKTILKKFLYPLFLIAFNHPNQVLIVQNSHDKRQAIKFYGINPKKIILFRGSGIRLSNFTNFIEVKSTITICLASRLLIEKGILDFVSAAKILNRRGYKAKFILAGDIDQGNPSSLNKKDLIKISNDNLIEVLGFQKDIPELFSRSHIVCLPSYYGEGLPKVLMEAAAAGRTIVTSDVPGCRDAIIPNKTGLLVPPKKPEKLADALQWLIDNPSIRVSMGKAAREFAIKEFKIEKIIENHLKVYQDLLKRLEFGNR